MAETGENKRLSYDGDYMADGKFAEAVIIAWLNDSPQVEAVVDIRDKEDWQSADCDFLLKRKDGAIEMAEAKSDRHLGKTPNVLVELLRVRFDVAPIKWLRLGWGGRSPIQWVFYFAPHQQSVYAFSADKLRKSAQNYFKRERKNAHLDIVNTDSQRVTINVLMPIANCLGAYRVYDVSKYVKTVAEKSEKAKAA